MRRIAILGSTGSIGTQALDVISRHPQKFEVEVLTAQNNADLLIEQAINFKPNCVVITNEDHYEKVKGALDKHDIKVYAGEKALTSVMEMDSIDLVGHCVGWIFRFVTNNESNRNRQDHWTSE